MQDYIVFRLRWAAHPNDLETMGIKYHYEVKDHKLADRFQRLQQSEGAPKPGMRTPKKLTRKERDYLAKKKKADEES
ncbi:MAG: hypothetical protein HOH58_08970 [Opitutaceae bacterium]|nr:hypothetical protein [Opitutaceae bacterium]